MVAGLVRLYILVLARGVAKLEGAALRRVLRLLRADHWVLRSALPTGESELASKLCCPRIAGPNGLAEVRLGLLIRDHSPVPRVAHLLRCLWWAGLDSVFLPRMLDKLRVVPLITSIFIKGHLVSEVLSALSLRVWALARLMVALCLAVNLRVRSLLLFFVCFIAGWSPFDRLFF